MLRKVDEEFQHSMSLASEGFHRKLSRKATVVLHFEMPCNRVLTTASCIVQAIECE